MSFGVQVTLGTRTHSIVLTMNVLRRYFRNVVSLGIAITVVPSSPSIVLSNFAWKTVLKESRSSALRRSSVVLLMRPSWLRHSSYGCVCARTLPSR